MSAPYHAELRPLWVSRRGARWIGGGGLLVAGVLGAVVPALLFRGFSLAGVLGFTLVGCAFALGWRRFRLLHQKQMATVDADDRGLLANGALLVARDDLVEGYVQPGPAAYAVIKARGSVARVNVLSASLEDAEALLRALRLDAGAARITFWAPSPIAVHLGAQLAAVAAWVASGAIAAQLQHPLVMPVWILAYFAMVLLPTRVVAGADGVRIGWLGRGRFIPYRRVTGIRVESWGMTLHVKDAPLVKVRFEPATWWARRNNWLLRAMFRGQRAALEQRLREGLRAHGGRTPDVDAGALLARGERTPEEWLGALRAIGAGESGYRSASLPRDVLWRVAENPSAPPDERVAAAVALREKLSADERARLDALAEATAAPRVRVALAAAATRGATLEEERAAEEELEAALADCEDEARATRRA